MAPIDKEPDERSAIAIAMAWSSQVMTISAEMVLPAVGGHWLDGRWGTRPVLLIVGVVFGFALGMWHLIQLTRHPPGGQKPKR